MSVRTILVRNVLSNWAGLLLGVVVGFFLSPFLVRSLGDSMYGLWVLLVAIMGYMGLLDTGLKTSIVRYVSRFNAVSDHDSLNRVLSTSFALYGGLSLVVAFLTVMVAGRFGNVFKVSPDDLDIVRTVVYLAGAGVAVTLPISVFGGLLVGLQRYDQLNKANIILLAVRSAAIVVFISLGFGIVALSAIQLTSQILLGVLLARYAYKQYPKLTFRLAACTKDMAKTLYSYSGFMLMNNIAMFSLFYSSEMIVGFFMGTAAVTYFAIATGLVHYLSKFVGAMTQVLHPYASDQEARGNTEKIKQIIMLGTKGCLLIVLPVALTYIVLGKTFIGLWMGPKYAELSGTVLMICAAGRIVWLSQSSTGNILLGIGKHRVITSVNIATGVASMALSAVLVQRYGVIGVAIGSAVPLIVSQIGMVIYISKVFEIPLGQYFNEAVAGPLAASVPFSAALLLIEALARPEHLASFFAEVALALPLFAIPAYFLCFTPSERQAYFHRYLRWTTVTMKGAS